MFFYYPRWVADQQSIWVCISQVILDQTQRDPWKKALSLSLSLIYHNIQCLSNKKILFSSKMCHFRPWTSMNNRKRGNGYSVTGPKYCDGSFRPRKFYFVILLWLWDLTMFYFPPTECEIRQSYFYQTAYQEKVTNVATLKNCEGICQRDPVSNFFKNYCWRHSTQ